MKFWRLLDLGYALISGDHERLLSGSQHFYVAQVEICGDPPDRASAFLVQDLRDQTAYLAERVPHIGSPVILRLEFSSYYRAVERRHRHDRPPSRLIQVTAAVVSPDGGTELGRTALGFAFDFSADARRNDDALDLQRQRRVDATAAEDLLERIYGTKDWDRFMHPEFSGY